ncbi:hypothetical protein LTR37_016729 [Vermiconidia calcicola]|uniref:Uncharacterized protein n=1 Tax=Vermiconidia calcicola TaxID=1690605 RepID=A0ACC3MNN3_9PEZI|nr:hypothetical protein LTR37_016729 [Vermiconidia calcicola]
MNAGRLTIDLLWQCLCPSWTWIPTKHTARALVQGRRPAIPRLNAPRVARGKSDAEIRRYQNMSRNDGGMQAVLSPFGKSVAPQPSPVKPRRTIESRDAATSIDYSQEPTQYLYNHLRGAAIDGKVTLCRYIAEMLVKERKEKPSLPLYNTLILSNIGYEQGAAWRVAELLDDLEKDGLQPDIGTCHAALKVLSVHVDHLLRNDILHYMSRRWYQLSEDGAHDVAAGLLREGLFEQGVERLDVMRREGMRIQGWLLDMAVYILCEASEISEAYRIMRHRVDTGELNLSRGLWLFFLDKASDARHHAATTLAWNAQVNQNFINPSSGICLNVLATASQAADAVMATDVFTNLSRRGTTFKPIHYELLINTYLSQDEPDIQRALSILTIMALEKLEPTPAETRSLYMYMRDIPGLLPQALSVLHELHEQGRRIPIAALNLLIECYVDQSNLADALKLYKQIHTFVPISEGAKKTFANIETFNLLLKGCRRVDPPDEHQASFLVSELLALRIKPTALTYDRLILLFVQAGLSSIQRATDAEDSASRTKLQARGTELLDWSFRHFADMRPLGWLPRFGTLEKLSVALAEVGDAHSWDVLQVAEDNADSIDGWVMKGGAVRRSVEKAWATSGGDDGMDREGGSRDAGDDRSGQDEVDRPA